MADVWIGRVSRYLEKLFNVKGGPLLVDIEAALRPTILVPTGVEERYLQGYDRFAAGVNVAASAANNSGVRLRNPAGSNVIAVIERLVASEPANDIIAFRFSSINVITDLATVPALGIIKLDPRGRNSASCILSDQNTAVGVPVMSANQFTYDGNQVLANTAYSPIRSLDDEILLLPGAGIQVEAVLVNTALNCFFVWRERPLEQSESS